MLLPSVSRRALAMALSACLLSAALAGCAAKREADNDPQPSPPPAKADSSTSPPTETKQPETVTRPKPFLSGAISVMVENSPQARPQSGLEKADLVYEFEAEGGVSRFMSLYYQDAAEKIGPVRSARMGAYDIATAYAVPYAHAGGNNDVLIALKEQNRRLLNLDEINTCGPCFWRSKDRVAPHNLYTSTELIEGRAKAVGFGLKPLDRFPEGGAMAGGTPVPTIAFSWGPRTQDVTWTWNGKRYERAQSGKPHVMESGTRLEADNVIVLFTRYVWDQAAQWGEGQNNITIVGSGNGYLYRDGKVYAIRWTKNSREEHYALTTPDGAPVQLAVGQTWIEILKSGEHLVQGAPQ